jgi:hypothetical protein
MMIRQRLFALLMNDRQALDQHVCQVVQDASRLDMDQRHRQGQPLPGFHVQHSGRVQRPGLRRKMLGLRRRDADQHRWPQAIPSQPDLPV